jgi:hypothetical protein
MAGRPRGMLRRVQQLRDAAGELAGAIEKACPPAYLATPERHDRLSTEWNDCVSLSAFVLEKLDGLCSLLREKIDERGPIDPDGTLLDVGDFEPDPPAARAITTHTNLLPGVSEIDQVDVDGVALGVANGLSRVPIASDTLRSEYAAGESNALEMDLPRLVAGP